QSKLKPKFHCWRVPDRGPIWFTPQVSSFRFSSFSEASCCLSFSRVKSADKLRSKVGCKVMALLRFSPLRLWSVICKALGMMLKRPSVLGSFSGAVGGTQAHSEPFVPRTWQFV